jgi:hypothetical protein
VGDSEAVVEAEADSVEVNDVENEAENDNDFD